MNGVFVAMSNRALKKGEWVKHGDGILTHTTPNRSVEEDLYDDLFRWRMGEDVEQTGMLLVKAPDGLLWKARP